MTPHVFLGRHRSRLPLFPVTQSGTRLPPRAAVQLYPCMLCARLMAVGVGYGRLARSCLLAQRLSDDALTKCCACAQAAIFGNGDGSSLTFAYYYALPSDFDPASFHNQARRARLRAACEPARHINTRCMEGIVAGPDAKRLARCRRRWGCCGGRRPTAARRTAARLASGAWRDVGGPFRALHMPFTASGRRRSHGCARVVAQDGSFGL
jgi:hypothetical protein